MCSLEQLGRHISSQFSPVDYLHVTTIELSQQNSYTVTVPTSSFHLLYVVFLVLNICHLEIGAMRECSKRNACITHEDSRVNCEFIEHMNSSNV